MLDYDGTLAPFCVDRKAAVVDKVLIEPLHNVLNNEKIKTAIITGRSSVEMMSLWRFSKPIQIWGSHGRERLFEDGRHEALLLSDEEVRGLHLASKSLLDISDTNNVEVKPFSVAFHTRREVPDSIIECAQELMSTYSNEYGFELHQFNGGFELKTKGRSKADAAKTLINEHQNHPAAYFGDDLTDEDAFGVVSNIGLAVLVETKRENTKSNYFMNSREELSDFLTELNKALK